jgi:hypothetical protein
MRRLPRLAPLLPAALLLSVACSNTEAPIVDPVEHELVVARDGARGLDAHIAVGGGDLEIHGGPCPLMKAMAHYDADRNKPQVDYWVDDNFRGKLDVTTSEAGSGSGFTEWNVCLTDALPTSLSVRHDGDAATLRLGGLQLDDLDLDLDVHRAKIDLIGRRYRNTKAKLAITRAGSDVTLRVPKDVGVRIVVETKLPGEVETTLRKTDDGYVNSAYGSTPVSLEITVKAQGGTLKIESG